MNYPTKFLNQFLPTFEEKYRQQIKEADKELPFQIQRLEDLDSLKSSRHVIPRILNRYEIIWIIKGSGNYMMDMEKHAIAEDRIYFFYPGQLYQFDPEKWVSGYRISFSPEFFYVGGEQFALPDSLNLQKERNIHCFQTEQTVNTELEKIIISMINELSNSFPFRKVAIKGLLSIFILYFSRGNQVATQVQYQNNNHELFKRFSILLEHSFTTMKLVSEYANELNISPNYLCEITRQISGYSPRYHIQQRIVLEAKRLAMCSNARMKSVALELGFQDYAHFSKYFKNSAGISFSIFKKTNQNDLSCFNGLKS